MSFAEGTPTATVKLGGREFTIGWTWGAKRRAFDEAEKRGRPMRDEETLLRNLPVVLWASMDKETRETVTVDEIEEMVNPKNELAVVSKLASLFEKSEPEPEKNEGPAAADQPTAGSSISMTSGQSESMTSA